MNWEIKHFSELSTKEIYLIFQLRIAVFVVEQNCPYQDADHKDFESFHIMGYDNADELLAYARILPAGISFPEVSIGRVVTSPKARGTGAGKLLMKECIRFIQIRFGNVPIRIGAQCYLEKFYSGFGFKNSGDTYLEDDIPHVEMLLPAY